MLTAGVLGPVKWIEVARYSKLAGASSCSVFAHTASHHCLRPAAAGASPLAPTQRLQQIVAKLNPATPEMETAKRKSVEDHRRRRVGLITRSAARRHAAPI
jgi:hypothetical protein